MIQVTNGITIDIDGIFNDVEARSLVIRTHDPKDLLILRETIKKINPNWETYNKCDVVKHNRQTVLLYINKACPTTYLNSKKCLQDLVGSALGEFAAVNISPVNRNRNSKTGISCMVLQ